MQIRNEKTQFSTKAKIRSCPTQTSDENVNEAKYHQWDTYHHLGITALHLSKMKSNLQRDSCYRKVVAASSCVSFIVACVCYFAGVGLAFHAVYELY